MSGIRLLLSIFCFLTINDAQAQDYVPGEVIVKMRTSANSTQSQAMSKLSSGHGMLAKKSWRQINMHHFTLKPGENVNAALVRLRSDSEVEFAEPNYILRKAATKPEQVLTASQVQAMSTPVGQIATTAPIDLPAVWNRAVSLQRRPIVAIIDTGLDPAHPAFTASGALWINRNETPANHIDDDGNGFIDDYYGWNFVENTERMLDDEGHGTHVAGIVLSVDQNIFAANLLSSKVQIMPLRFMNAEGLGTTSDAVNAIAYAVKMGASVVNNSWGGPSYSAALEAAISDAYEHGVLVVSAAGNNGADNDNVPFYPANLKVPNILAVAASDNNDHLSSFSNYGKNSVSIASPGVSVLSTLPGGRYGYLSGTSMASPFVSGTAAQMLVDSPNMLGHQLKAILLQQISVNTALADRVQTSGRLNPMAAIGFAGTAVVEGTQPAFKFSYNPPVSAVSSSGGCEFTGQQNQLSTLSMTLMALLLVGQVIGFVLFRQRVARQVAKADPERSPGSRAA